jgi:hypothetical protein
MEHRWGRRTSVDVVVRLIGSPGAIGTGRLLNVSATGAFVQTKLHLPLFTPVRVEPIAGPLLVSHPCAGRAYVVRQVSAGVGIEWFAVATDPVRTTNAGLTVRDALANSKSMAPETGGG